MKNSVSRETAESVKPPSRPARAPSGTPIRSASIVEPSLTSSDVWPPFSSRRSSSRPSVPSEPSTNSVVSRVAKAAAVFVRDERLGYKTEDEHQQEDDQAAERELVPLEAPPEQRPLPL